MGDGDHLVAESELEEELGRVRHEADDAHTLVNDMALLDDDEIDRALAQRPDWRRAGAELVLERSFADFAGAMRHINAVADLAEERGHHPDLEVHGWNNVRLRVSTHSEGGITAADLELVAAIDALS